MLGYGFLHPLNSRQTENLLVQAGSKMVGNTYPGGEGFM
jgi:hypothetical protein